jgi:uncharacterized membrane protein YkoI
MWKKAFLIGAVSLGSFSVMGCHSHRHPTDQPAMSSEDEKNETQVTVDELPPRVVNAVHKHVPDGTIVSAETMIWEGKVVYEIDVKSGDTVYEVRVHKTGKFISKTIDKD